MQITDRPFLSEEDLERLNKITEHAHEQNRTYWVYGQWQISKKYNPYKIESGFCIVCFVHSLNVNPVTYGYVITEDGTKLQSPISPDYPTMIEAKNAAYDMFRDMKIGKVKGIPMHDRNNYVDFEQLVVYHREPDVIDEIRARYRKDYLADEADNQESLS